MSMSIEAEIISRPIYNLIQLGLEDYEDNDFILDIVHDLKQFFEGSNCTCKISKNQKDLRTCYEKIGFKQFFERYIELKGLEKYERELVIKTQLLTFEINNELENSKVHKYKYCFNASFPICQPTYLKICGINKRFLNTLQDDLYKNGLKERIHGNTGRVPKIDNKIFLDTSITFSVKQFLIQYSNIYGLPSPLRHKNDSGIFIYLPTDKNITSIYEEYKTYYYTEYNITEKVISYSTFRKLWYEMMPNLKFQTPGSDLCETCEKFKAKLQVEKHNADKYEQLKNEFENHKTLAQNERQYYNNNISKSESDSSITHICYDWAQNVFMPYSPQQVGSIYFKSTFSVHLFGVCKTKGKQNHQLNFVIGENELPKGTSKGANTTLNMVYFSLQKFVINGKKNLQITCDNCSGQNKNNLSLWFWSWIIMIGWFENITVNFMIPGHTKFICDSFFGKIKKVYWKKCVNTIDDIRNIINNSSESNEAILFNDEINWKWYDFSTLFKDHFKSLPNIMQYHHFRFSNLPEDIGKVYISKISGGIETSFQLLKSNNFNKNDELNTIPLVLLTNERQKYLYSKIRQHVDDPFKDIYCANPIEN